MLQRQPLDFSNLLKTLTIKPTKTPKDKKEKIDYGEGRLGYNIQLQSILENAKNTIASYENKYGADAVLFKEYQQATSAIEESTSDLNSKIWKRETENLDAAKTLIQTEKKGSHHMIDQYLNGNAITFNDKINNQENAQSRSLQLQADGIPYIYDNNWTGQGDSYDIEDSLDFLNKTFNPADGDMYTRQDVGRITNEIITAIGGPFVVAKQKTSTRKTDKPALSQAYMSGLNLISNMNIDSPFINGIMQDYIQAVESSNGLYSYVDFKRDKSGKQTQTQKQIRVKDPNGRFVLNDKGLNENFWTGFQQHATNFLYRQFQKRIDDYDVETQKILQLRKNAANGGGGKANINKAFEKPTESQRSNIFMKGSTGITPGYRSDEVNKIISLLSGGKDERDIEKLKTDIFVPAIEPNVVGDIDDPSFDINDYYVNADQKKLIERLTRQRDKEIPDGFLELYGLSRKGMPKFPGQVLPVNMKDKYPEIYNHTINNPKLYSEAVARYDKGPKTDETQLDYLQEINKIYQKDIDDTLNLINNKNNSAQQFLHNSAYATDIIKVPFNQDYMSQMTSDFLNKELTEFSVVSVSPGSYNNGNLVPGVIKSFNNTTYIKYGVKPENFYSSSRPVIENNQPVLDEDGSPIEKREYNFYGVGDKRNDSPYYAAASKHQDNLYINYNDQELQAHIEFSKKNANAKNAIAQTPMRQFGVATVAIDLKNETEKNKWFNFIKNTPHYNLQSNYSDAENKVIKKDVNKILQSLQPIELSSTELKNYKSDDYKKIERQEKLETIGVGKERQRITKFYDKNTNAQVQFNTTALLKSDFQRLSPAEYEEKYGINKEEAAEVLSMIPDENKESIYDYEETYNFKKINNQLKADIGAQLLDKKYENSGIDSDARKNYLGKSSMLADSNIDSYDDFEEMMKAYIEDPDNNPNPLKELPSGRLNVRFDEKFLYYNIEIDITNDIIAKDPTSKNKFFDIINSSNPNISNKNKLSLEQARNSLGY
jgi:hypothetical protein